MEITGTIFPRKSAMSKFAITCLVLAVVMAASILYMEWRLQSDDEVSKSKGGKDDA